MKTFIDSVVVIFVLCVLKLRWWYFHICPWYRKFSMDGKDVHFQNMRRNSLHSQMKIEFREDSIFYKLSGLW